MEKRNTASVNWMYAILLVVALAVFGVGVYLAIQKPDMRDWSMLAAGSLGLLLVLTTWIMTGAMATSRELAMKRSDEITAEMSDRLQSMTVILNEIHESGMLSDRAKAVAYREKDRDALRRAIREDMAKRDWEAALVLADDMERVFGYRQEAQKFRDEINKVQEDVIRRHVNEGLALIDRHCRAEAWSDAVREAERMQSAFRGDPQVMALPQDIERRRQDRKSVV